jgi:mannose-binding lectin
MIVSAQSSGNQSTNSGSWTPNPGLAINLPRGVGEQALLILNVSNLYAQGNSNPGGNFGLQVNGAVQSAFASFTYNEQNPPSTGRVPTTLCAVAPLSQTGPVAVVAVWSGVRGATVRIDSQATLTAIID